jgi:hypothetical protein
MFLPSLSLSLTFLIFLSFSLFLFFLLFVYSFSFFSFLTGWDKMDPDTESHQRDITRLTESLFTQIIPITANNWASEMSKLHLFEPLIVATPPTTPSSTDRNKERKEAKERENQVKKTPLLDLKAVESIIKRLDLETKMHHS